MERHGIDKLLRKISEGDNEAFGELYRQTRRGVFSFLYTYFHNYHDSEDGMQTVYLKIKRNIHSYQHGTNGIAWMLQIAKNHAIDEKRRRRYDDSAETLEDTDCHFEDGSVTDFIERNLDEEEARIVTLRIMWQYKHREIGEIMNLPTGTVTSKYKRALGKLKKVLKEERV